MPSPSIIPRRKFVIFSPELAALIGVNEAILLPCIDYLVAEETYDPRGGRLKDGLWWIPFTHQKLQSRLPCFSLSTIRRTLDSLIKQACVLREFQRDDAGNITGYWITTNPNAHAIFTEEKFLNLRRSSPKLPAPKPSIQAVDSTS